MSFTTHKLPGEPIIVHTMDADYSVARDFTAGVDSIIAVLDAQSEPTYLVVDMDDAHFGLDDVMSGASQAARQEGALLRHPRLRETLLITQSDLFRLAARGLDSDVFGHVRVKLFATVDEALAYCRRDQDARPG